MSTWEGASNVARVRACDRSGATSNDPQVRPFAISSVAELSQNQSEQMAVLVEFEAL